MSSKSIGIVKTQHFTFAEGDDAMVLDSGPARHGLVYQARAEIWTIVNELMFTIKDSKRPIVQLALMTDVHAGGLVEHATAPIVVPFTTNYYAAFHRLGRLSASRSKVLSRSDILKIALRRLQWSPYAEDLKVIFVVGEGSFTRNLNEVSAACRAAVDAGVVINTLYCGLYKLGIGKHWAEPAYCTGGQYMGINHHRRLNYTKTPVDGQLLDLNQKLNETYRLYADRWRKLWKQQRDQDREVALVSKEALLQRIVTKAAQGLFMNATDALLYEQTGTWGLKSDIRPEDLPLVTTGREFNQLREKTQASRDIREEILYLASQRYAIMTARQLRSGSTRPTLSQAVLHIFREQSQAKGFQPVSPDSTVGYQGNATEQEE